MCVHVGAILGIYYVAGVSTASAQTSGSRGWRVWVRQEPCSGRFDWLSVAKEPTGGGKNIYVPYETVMAKVGCTQTGPRGCTFKEAQDVMESLRGNSKFSDYCCRSYSVWENSADGDKSVVLGLASPGTGWSQLESNLCCEEAEELAGKPGSCSGGRGAGKGNAGHGYSGIWTVRNEFGLITLDLKQVESRVSGTMSNAWGSGRFDGTMSGSTVRFTWDLVGEKGSGEVKLSADGRSFSGTWSVESTGQTYPLTGTKDK